MSLSLWIILRDCTLTTTPGRLQNNGQLYGDGAIEGEVVNQGQISPGESVGIITIEGDYTQAGSGVLALQAGGLQPGVDSDQFVVTGTATLGGNLRIILADEFFPPVGAEIRVLQSGSPTGTFSDMTVENASSRWQFDLLPDSSGVLLKVSVREIPNFMDWRTASFTSEELNDPDISGADADPDRDGYPNGLEYALNLRPTLVDQNPISVEITRTPSGQPETITLSFPWAKGMTDGTHEVVSSSDLTSWESVTTEMLAIEDRGTHSQITLSAIPFLETDPVGFAQLMVKLTPHIVGP